MKKIIAFVISACIMLSSVNAVAAVDFSSMFIETSDIGAESTEVLSNKTDASYSQVETLQSFTEDFCLMVNAAEPEKDAQLSGSADVQYGGYGQDEPCESTNRLIVKSSETIETLDAVGYINGYNDLHILQFDDYESFSAAYDYYIGQPDVEYVQEDMVFTETDVEEELVFSEATVECPTQYQSDMFGYTDAKENMAEGEVTIAVVDSGVANDHELLADRVIPTGFDSINNVSCYDDRGHGTHVAGIIVSNTKSNVKIKPYKVLNKSGTGTDTQVYLGIMAAIEDGVDIINLSLSREGESELLAEAVTEAYDAGITVVASAGNDGINLSEVIYTPASLPQVICAVSIETTKYKADTSNWGSSRDISAPGVSIISSYLDNTYKIMSGTSMAAPFISSAVAYILAEGTYYSPDEIYDTLYTTSKRGGGTHNIHYACPGTLVTASGKCATPVFKNETGVFAGYVEVEISCETENAEILYHTTEMEEGAFCSYTGPFMVYDTTTVSAYAICKNYSNSTTASVTYTKADNDQQCFNVENNILLSYTGTDSTVSVPLYYNNVMITEIADGAFKDNTAMQNLILSSQLSTVGADAFNGCTNLLYVTATGIQSIGDRAFYGCSSLDGFMGSSVKSIGNSAFENAGKGSFAGAYSTTVGDRAFYNCGFSSINLNYTTTFGSECFSGSKNLVGIIAGTVSTIGRAAFSGCTALKSISLSATTTIPERTFENCSSLEKVTANKVTIVEDYAFSGCTALESVSLSAMTTIPERTFENCSSLETITANKVTIVEDYAFYGCTALKTIKMSAITTVGNYAFAKSGIETLESSKIATLGEKSYSDCLSLSAVSLSKIAEIDLDVFGGSINITSFNFPAITGLPEVEKTFCELFPNITVFKGQRCIGDVPDNYFKDCQKLQEIYLPGVVNIGAGAFENTDLQTYTLTQVVSIGESALKNSSISDVTGLSYVTSVGEYAFAYCENLGEVNLSKVTALNPNVFEGSEASITRIDLSLLSEVSGDADFMFADFDNLQEILIPGIPCIPAGAFEGCSKLTYVDISKYSQEIGERAFKDCIALENVSMYNVTSIGEGAFENCKSLTKFSNGYVKDFDFDILYGCTELQWIELDAVTEFPVDENGRLALGGVEKLTTFIARTLTDIPDHFLENFSDLVYVILPSVLTVGDYAFYNTPIITMEGFEDLKEIGDYAFYGTKITGIDSYCCNDVEKIGDYSFAECTELEKVQLENVSYIGSKAFENCTGLQKILLFDSNVKQDIKLDAFDGCCNVEVLCMDKVKSLPVTEDGKTYVSGMPKLVDFCASWVTEVPDDYFIGNPELKDVNFSRAKIVGDRAFKGTVLESCNMPLVESVGNYSFYKTAVTSLTFDKLTNIGNYAFAECTALETFSAKNLSSIGDNAFQYDTALTSFIVNGDIAIPDYCFFKCSSLSRVCAIKNNIAVPAYITRLGENAFYGCSSLDACYIRFDYLEYMGSSCLDGVDILNIYSADVAMPALKAVSCGAFQGLQFRSISLENIVDLSDLPYYCDFAVIGSDVKYCGFLETRAVLYAYEGSAVEKMAQYKDWNFKYYNETDAIYKDISRYTIWYDTPLTFDAAGFNMTYKWYGCNNIDRSDAELIVDSGNVYSEVNVIEPLACDGEESKYRYFFCVATSTENGNVIDIQSGLSKNAFASIGVTDDTFANYPEQMIFTNSLDNVNNYDGIFSYVDSDCAYVTPSYSSGDTVCYGTGSRVVFGADENNSGYRQEYVENTIIVYGDINGDGVIDALDASQIALVSNGMGSFSDDIYQSAADTNSDSAITVEDYQAVINKVVA